MYKIRKVDFLNHPILGNLSLNFCDANGHAVDTVIFAGENGVGKSTILNALYELITQKLNFEANIEYEFGERTINLKFYWKEYSQGQRYLTIQDDTGRETMAGISEAQNKYLQHGIFSDVDINFQSNNLTSVTSLTLDGKSESRRSSNNLPTEIKQLIIDIQALDDADVSYWVKTHPHTSTDNIDIHERMPRFTGAFDRMFDDLKYSRVENMDGHKAILFEKNGKLIQIDALSSGEKQIVYRGCFLLKDANAMNGAFVFIDEPEISLHPKWQMKVMDYYKGIFTDELNDIPALCFRDTINNRDYITYLYLDDGSLKELFTATGSSAQANAGTMIASLSDFQIEEKGNGFYYIFLQNTVGNTSEFFLHSSAD